MNGDLWMNIRNDKLKGIITLILSFGLEKTVANKFGNRLSFINIKLQ